MLQNRIINVVLVCLIIATTNADLPQRNQGQKQGRKNSQSLQTRQLEPIIIKERELKAREMLKYMNTEADVCRDFYDYACGNWLKEQNIDMTNNEGELISVESEMEKLVNKQLQAILQEPINSKDSMASKVVKSFYRSCIRVAASSPAQRQFMHSFVLNHGGLPDIKGTHWQSNYNWIDVIADLRRNYGLDILIGLRTEKNSNNYKIYFVEEPKTTLLPVELCSALAARQTDKNDTVFEKIQEEIKGNLQNWFELNESTALRMAGAIISFEFDLCKYMRLDQTATTPLDNGEQEEEEQAEEEQNLDNVKRPTISNKMHGQRQKLSDSPQNLHSLSAAYQINFTDFVARSLDMVTAPQVYFRSEKYFQKLSTLAIEDIPASFANYIMYRALSEINFPLQERNGQRPFHCTNQLMRYLPQVMRQLYSEKFGIEKERFNIEGMISAISSAFQKYLEAEANWISDNTKRRIKNRLGNFKLSPSSYSQNRDFLRGFPLNDGHDYYWHKLQNIMMYSANQTILQPRMADNYYNQIEASAVSLLVEQRSSEYDLVMGYGIMQKPYYSPFYASSLKYSSLGVGIAREIIKTYILQGLKQNPMNTIDWDKSTKENFSLIAECFRAQMSNNFHNNPNVFRNATKLQEIIVDTIAVNIAFRAYLSLLETWDQNSIELLQLETLPNINFTSTQLFFIHFAQAHCAARNNLEWVPDFLPLYRRTIEQCNINGPLSNNVEFGREFNCDLGSNMNVDDKCF